MAPLSLNILFKVNQLLGLNRLEMPDTHTCFSRYFQQERVRVYTGRTTNMFVFFFTHGEKKTILFFSLTSGLEISRKKKSFQFARFNTNRQRRLPQNQKNKKILPFLSAFSNAMNLALICDNKIEKYVKKS
jgi:hypothetical protein